MQVSAFRITHKGGVVTAETCALVQSGSTTPVGDIADAAHQSVYDSIVDETGCSTANDTLQCLRDVPLNTFFNASNNTYSLSSYQVCLNFASFTT